MSFQLRSHQKHSAQSHVIGFSGAWLNLPTLMMVLTLCILPLSVTQTASASDAFEVIDPSVAHNAHNSASPQNETTNHQSLNDGERTHKQSDLPTSEGTLRTSNSSGSIQQKRFKTYKISRWKNAYLIPDLEKIHGPSPDQLTPLDAGKNSVDTSTDLIYGLPFDQSIQNGIYPPYTAATECLLATDNGDELFSRHIYNLTAMASLTKIMTALVAYDLAADRSMQVSISPEAAAVSGSQIGYLTGDTPTVDELIKGLLIHSGNDAALALSEAFMTTPEFLDRMNQKARELGCYDTQFESPHGLDSQNHFSTVHDLFIMSHALLNNPYLRDIVKTSSVTLPVHGVDKVFHNTNPLLGNYSGVTGIKTGFTNRAGYALICSCTQDDISLLAVVLGTHSFKQRESETKKLLDWGYAHYPYQQLASRGDYLGKIPFPYRYGWFYPVTVLRTTCYRFAVDDAPLTPEFSASYLEDVFKNHKRSSHSLPAYLASLSRITENSENPGDSHDVRDMRLSSYCCPKIGSACPQLTQEACYQHLSRSGATPTHTSQSWKDGLMLPDNSNLQQGIFSFHLLNRLKIAEGNHLW